MRVQLDVEINPFSVPNFVTIVEKPKPRQDGFKPSEGIPLSELDEITLEKMCDEFRASVFKKAGKSRPPQSE